MRKNFKKMSKSENGKIHAPRVCHVIKQDNFDGYGFNLHAEKGKPGQYIGKVDEGSPAESAGLKQGDRIIEVNGVNIGSETHKQVVQRIKAIASEVQLLVVDPSVTVTKDNKLIEETVTKTNGNISTTIETTVSQIETTTETKSTSNGPPTMRTPDIVVQLPSPPSSPKDDDDSIDSVTISVPPTPVTVPPPSEPSPHADNQNKASPKTPENDRKTSEKIESNNNAGTTNNNTSQKSASPSEEVPTQVPKVVVPPVIPPVPIANSMNSNKNNSSTKSEGLNLNMTAAELRAKLSAKKKFDPKSDPVDLRKKFEIVQKL